MSILTINKKTEKAMEHLIKNYKKLYRFTAPLKSKSFMGCFLNFIEKSNNLPFIKVNISVKKDILNLEIYCNSTQDFELVNKELFDFFKLGEIKSFLLRYYDLENGRFIIQPGKQSTDNFQKAIEN